MGDDVTSTESTAETSAGDSHSAADNRAANSPGSSGASGTAVTAPASSPEREALERLRNGESARDIQRDFHSRAAGEPDKETRRQGDKETAQDQGTENLGLTEKELNALKRGKFDLAALKMMPPANRKAIARAMATSQAEADRQYQLAKEGKRPALPTASQPGGKPEDAAKAGQEAADAADESHPTDSQEEAADGQPTPDDPNAQQAGGDGIAGLFGDYRMDPKDFQTLVDIGGEAFAEAQQARESALVRHMQQAVQPIANIVLGMANLMENQEFDSALTTLKKDPAFAELGEAETSALKEKARLLIRAAGDPASYRFSEAVQDAAASLFKTNVQRQAQAALAQKRNAALAASPDKGDGRKAAPRQRTEGDRMRAIYDVLQANPGMNPRDAARMVDAA